MRRIVALLLALLMTLTMTTLSWAEGELIIADGPGPESPASGTCGAASNVGGRDSVKWEVTPNGGRVAYEDEDGNTVLRPAYTLTISGEGEMMDNPGLESAKNWAVRDKNRLPYRDLITEVIVEEGVTSLGEGFCIYMQEDAVIKLPASLAKIGRNAFAEIEKPVELAEGNAVFKVVDNVLFTSDMKTLVRYFSDRKTVKSYEIPSSVETLADTSFEKARLEEVIIGKNVKNIGFRAFRSCLMLKTVTFAEGNSLGEFDNIQAFYNCPKLESIDLPNSCTFVINDTFRDCPNLRTIVARGITAREGFRSNYGSYHGFYKATVSYDAALLHGNYNGEVNGIGAAEYDVNGTQAERLDWYTLEGVKGDKDSINGTSTTVYAVYKADCSFDTNGGTGDVSAIKSYVAPGLDDGAEIANLPQSEVEIPATIPTRDGYAFVGWNTEADGSGVSYNAGNYLKTTNQPLTKLYAQWGKNADDGTVYTVSCDTSLTYTGTSQTPSVTVKMTKGSDTTTLAAGAFRVEADTNSNVGMHTGTVYLVNSDTNADTGVTIDFNYEIKKASCALTVTGETNVKGGGTVSLSVTGTSVEMTGDSDLGGSLASGVYSATVPDSTKLYDVTFVDAGDDNHEGGTKTVTVAVTARSRANLTLNETVKTVKAGVADSVTYTYSGDGTVTATSSDKSVAAVTVDETTKTISITPLKAGTADILVTGTATENYKPTAAVLVLTVTNAATIKSDAETKEIDAGAAKELIINVPDINGKPAKVVFNQAAADYLRGRGEDLTLKLTVIPVPDSLKNSEQFKNKSCIMVEITLTNDAGANVFASSVAGAKADVEFFGGTALENVTAYFVQSAGLTAQPVTYTAATGMIALHLEHFSKYLVAGDTPSTPAAPSSGGRRHYTGTPGAEITGGADQTKRAGDIIKVTAKSDGAKVSAVYVDGALVDGKYYIVSGNAVKLQGTYTATLSQGTHTLRVVYTNGAAVTTTFVLKGTTSPHTGDPGVGIYLASVVLSIAGSAYVFRKKKNDD